MSLENAIMNLEDQPVNFLRAIWRFLPNEGLVGLSHNDYYVNRDGVEEQTYYQTWQYASERTLIDWQEVGSVFNEDKDLRKRGLGSVYYNFSSRTLAMLNRKGDPKVLRGKIDELIAVGMIGGDLDCDKLGYPIDQAFQEIMSCPLPPSIVVHSGGGLQPIWLFNDAWMIRDQTSAYEYGLYSRGLMQWAAQYTKVHPDYSVNEPTRVLRLPGFRNNKLERHGAYAYLLHFDPDKLYSIDEIKSRVSLPDFSRERRTYTTAESGVYAVSKYLVDHLVHQTPPKGGDRHPTLRNIAAYACSADIPQEVIKPAIRKLAALWFDNDPTRMGRELDNLIAWPYDNGVRFDQGGDYAIRIEGDTVTVVTDAELDKQKQHEVIVKLDSAPELPPRKALDALRREQEEFLDKFLRAKYKRGYATLAVMRSSPGAGKTHAAVTKAFELIKEALDNGVEPPKVLYLTQFKMDNMQGRAWVRGMGIDPDAYPNLFGFFYARESERTEGYCANYDIAKSLGAKGYNVVKHVCNFCPFRANCEKTGYISQFDKLRDKLFVVARYQQGMIDDLQDGRKIVIIDESITDIIGREIKVTLNDMSLNKIDPVTYDQYKTEVTLSEKFLSALRSTIAQNEERKQQLGGYWLMHGLVTIMGKESFEQAMDLDKRIVEGLQAVDTSSVMAIAQSQPNFMRDLWRILRFEYEVFYSQGALRWNSRIIPYGMNLHVYPMESFTFNADVKVLCLDATSMPQYYDLAITDRHVETVDGIKYKAPRPRHTKTYDTKLAIRGVTTQYIGTENARVTYAHRIAEAKLAEVEAALEFDNPEIDPLLMLDEDTSSQNLTFKKAYTHNTKRMVEELRKKKFYAMAQLVLTVEELALKHDGSLLLVTYKGLANRAFLTDWIKAKKLIPESNIQWFGNLRGKNDWKDVKAVLIVGTPRIRETALLAKASIYHYQDSQPLDLTRAWRVLPYAQDTELPLGKETAFFGYKYYGYADDRVDRWYVHTIVSEIIQAYDRVRSNSSIDTKNIYIGTQFPSSEHVSAFRYWNSGNVSATVNTLLETEYRKSITDPAYTGYIVSEMVAKIMELGNCSDNLARDLYSVEFATGYLDTELGRVYWIEHFGKVTTVGRTSHVSNRETGLEGGLPDKVVKWLKQHPERLGSGDSMAKWYAIDNPLETAPSKPTMLAGKKKYEAWLTEIANTAKEARN